MARTELRTAAWLFLAVTCIYVLSAGGHLYAADDVQKLDALDAWLTRGTFAIADGWSDGVGGLKYAWFPLGASLLMLPGYLLGQALAPLGPTQPAGELVRAAISFQNASISALLVAVVFLAARAFGFSRRRSLFAAGALAFGTAVWPYAKTAWSEPATALAVFGGLVALWHGARTGRGPWLLAAGAALGAACLLRDELALVAVCAAGWLAWRERHDRARLLGSLAWLIAPLIAAAAVASWYQVVRYGSPFAYPNFRGPQTMLASDPLGRLASAVTNLYRWTLHPNQGLLWFSPALLVGLLGWRRFAARVPDAARLFLATMGPLGAFYLIGWGYSSWSWGLRYAYLYLPFLLIGAAALPLTRAPRRLAAAALTLGVGVQLLAIPHDFVYLYLGAIARTPGLQIQRILDEPVHGPLVLAARATPAAAAGAFRMVAAPPPPLPPGEASRRARREGVPDFWWLWLLGTTAPRGLVAGAALAVLLVAAFAAARVGRAALRAPGGAWPPAATVRRLAVFGTWDPTSPRTAMLLAGWRATGGEVIAVQEPMWPASHERLALATNGGTPGLARRWLDAQSRLWHRRGELAGADAILVPYPGHADMPLARLLASLASKPLAFDPFVGLHDTVVGDRGLASPHGWRARALLALDRLALGLADRILADTPEHGKFYATLGGLAPERVATVPVGADDRLFCPRDGREAPLEVLFYGRMIPLHGVEVILSAAKLLEDEPGLRFHLIGTGQVPIAQLIATQGTSNVRWTPDVPFDALPAALAGAAISLGIFADAPKAARVVPHKVYEAAAMGKAIVTRDSPAVRAAFGDDALVLVPPGDPAALAQALRGLARDPARRASLGRAARAAYEAAYDRAGIGAALARALTTEAPERAK